MTNFGYVFINEEGEYARIGAPSGFGTKQVIHWDSKDSATIFRNQNPREFPSLSTATALQAVETRQVSLQKWETTEDGKSIPVVVPQYQLVRVVEMQMEDKPSVVHAEVLCGPTSKADCEAALAWYTIQPIPESKNFKVQLLVEQV